MAVEQSAKKIELEKMLELIKISIIDPYDKASLPKNLDYEELLILSYFEKNTSERPKLSIYERYTTTRKQMDTA
ncbi:MAG: hypothetical protein UZ14_CFX002000983 [Chloroflexi bacterium OLB14]|nr:MAG: hypothetical protein UZ14_CFX002000983 [Chloroflexi bacterium OLB14]